MFGLNLDLVPIILIVCSIFFLYLYIINDHNILMEIKFNFNSILTSIRLDR